METSLATRNTLQANGYVMFEIPDPLHPAIVHFPIVLIFLGTLLSILTIFTRRGALPQYSAVVLILAAAGAQLAVNTGSDQVDDVIQRMPDSKPLILVHAEWGMKMRTAAVIAAVSALIALAFYRFGKFRRVLAFITTIITATLTATAMPRTATRRTISGPRLRLGRHSTWPSSRPSSCSATPRTRWR